MTSPSSTLHPGTLSSFSGALVELSSDVTIIKEGDGFLKQVGKYSIGTSLLVLSTSFALVETVLIFPFYLTAKTFELACCTLFSYRNVTWLTNNIVNPLGRAVNTSFLYVVIGGNRLFSRMFGEKYVRSTDRSIWSWFPSLQLNVAHASLAKTKSIPTEVNLSADQIAQAGNATLKKKDYVALSKALEMLAKKVETKRNTAAAGELAKETLDEYALSPSPIVLEKLLDLLFLLVGAWHSKIYSTASEAAKLAISEQKNLKKGLAILRLLQKRGEFFWTPKIIDTLNHLTDPEMIIDALDLIKKASEEGIINEGVVQTVLDVDCCIEGVRDRQVHIFKGLVRNGQAVSEASKFAQTLWENKSLLDKLGGLSLYKELVEKIGGEGHQAARAAAALGLRSPEPSIRLESIAILTKLPNVENHLTEMLNATDNLETVSIDGVKRLTPLFQALIDHNHSFPEVVRWADNFGESTDTDVIKEAKNLFVNLVKKRQGIEEATRLLERLKTEETLFLIHPEEFENQIAQAQAAIAYANSFRGRLARVVGLAE